jgi:pyrroline-5-carboxylate reductase
MMDTGDLHEQRFAVIGAGNIGRILIDRLLAVGVEPGRLVICDNHGERREAVAADYGVQAVSLPDGAACKATLILLATPPQVVLDVVQAIAPSLRPGQVLVSFAALISLERLEAALPPGVAVARVMPNAPSLVGAGINPVAFGGSATPEARKLLGALLAVLGDSIEVTDEQMNWCVGLSGAAMRSLLPGLEGMAQAGVEAGLSPGDARRVAAQVMRGTAALALETEASFAELKALTPMATVDEAAVAQQFYDAARRARETMEKMQSKVEGTR